MWTDGTLVSFDTETTGPDPETARIVTASIVVINGTTGHTSQHEWLIDPGVDIPAEATAVHGITTEHARERGWQPFAVLDEIMRLIRLHTRWDTPDDSAPLIIYNAPYDLTVLDREFRRHYDIPAFMDPVGPIVDPLVLDRALDKYRRGKRTLTAVSAHYGVPISDEDAHGSTADALCAARVAWKIGRAYPQACDDLDTLQVRQAAWHREWADHFGEYLTRQGKQDDVCRHWPTRPAPVVAR